MLTNADITIYHKSYDPTTRLDKWEPTQYQGVNWYGEQAATVGSNGLNAADTYVVRIPTDNMVEATKGDIVVKGLVSNAITGPAQLVKKYECFTVLAVRDNRRGSPNMHHWKIEGA